MYTYKFRLFFDEVEDFVRDFELLADQTFGDFHEVIIQNIKGLNEKELASFYVCDNQWNKIREITLIDMDDRDEDEEEEEDGEENKNYQLFSKITMDEAVLSDLIDEPHQRLIYEYDFLNMKTFFIELLKSSEASDKLTYPRCTASIGELPKQVNVFQKDAFDFSDLTDNEYDEDEDDEDFYSEEDLESLSDDIEF